MDPVGKESTHTNPTPSRMGLTTIFSSNGALRYGFSTKCNNVRPLDNPANIYSPITFSRATPSKFIGLTSLSEKENERPTTPLESQSRKQKLDEHAPMGIKAKRLKKLAEQLPDLGSVEGTRLSYASYLRCSDIMKMQEELNQQQAKVKTLEESAASYQKTVEEQQKETITLRSENDKLNDEVKVVQQAKETAITEVAAKTSLINEMEQEKVKLLKDLDDYKDQLHQVELQNEKHIQESKEHQKRSELLDATLKESAAQYMIQQLHQKEFIQEVCTYPTQY